MDTDWGQAAEVCWSSRTDWGQAAEVNIIAGIQLTNHSSSQKTRLNDLSYGIKI